MSIIPESIIRTPEGIYVLRDDSHLSRWIENHKRLDIADGQIAFYRRHIPAGGTVIDAGACLGDHTLTYAKLVGPTGRVLACEPHPLTFQALKLNFEWWKNVVVQNVALSDVESEMYFKPEPNIGASHVELTESACGVKVRCVPLDNYASGLTRCDFIHLDVEGFEVRALIGAELIIARHRPVIVLEINNACLARLNLVEADVLSVLKARGYRWQEIEPRHGPHLPQRDIICFHNDHPN